jgi:TonB family protein
MSLKMRFAVPLLVVFFVALDAGVSLVAQTGTPRKITHVEPVYPEFARQARVQGTVIVQITVGSDGRVSDARIIRSIPMLDQAALDAVKQWVYDAATIKKPITLTVRVPFGVAVPPVTVAPQPRPPVTVPTPAPPPAPVRAARSEPPAAEAAAATSVRGSGDLSATSLSVKGLNYETELTALYLGDFEHARLERASMEFVALFGSYLSAFGRLCKAHLPATKVEMTRSECAREQYPVNGYGVRVGPSTCIEYRDVGTGIYADPALYRAQQRVDAEVASNMIRATISDLAGNNPMGTAMRTMDAAMSVGRDMASLIEMNACASPGLKRLQENMRRLALGEPPLRLPGGETLASIRPKPPAGAFKDSDYAKLLDDLIAENSRGWMVNRYVSGSVSDVAISFRDELGRPSKITGSYLFEGLNGRSKGSVTVQFADGLPHCVYFSDFPNTCRTPSRRIITAYENGRYQR